MNFAPNAELGEHLFRNIKNGHIYELLYFATEATNGRDGILMAVYASREDGKVYTRELGEFENKFEPAGDAG